MKSKNRKDSLTASAAYPTDGLARVPQAAEFLAVSRPTLYRMISAGQIDHVWIRDVIRIPWKALHAIAKP